MGLFSSKYVTSVSATVTRAIENDKLPNAVKTGTLKSLLRKEDQADHILEELVSGLALKTNRMYRYGENYYEHGLPSGEIVTSNEGIPTLEAVLATLEGTPVTLEYGYYGPANNLHAAWIKLIDLYGYNPDTNQLGVLTASEGAPVYLDDMVIRVPVDTLALMEPGSLVQWGTSPKGGQSPTRPAWNEDYRWITKHSLVETPLGGGDPYAVAYWTKVQTTFLSGWIVPTPLVSITIPLDDLDDEADYFHAKYKVGGVTKYFMYKAGTGTYPSLDTFYDADPTIVGEFFPFAHFRYGKVSTATDKTTDEYKTSKKLVKYLGLNFDDVAEAIDENPDIADVEQAMLILAVPATTTVEIEQQYLFDFFKKLYLTAPETFTSNAMQILRSLGDPVSTSMVIQDKRFKFSLNNSGIIRQMVAGTLGPVGSYHSATSTSTVTYMVMAFSGGDSGSGLYEEQPRSRVIRHFSYRKQVTAFAYEEIQVLDLNMKYHMDSIYHVVGDGEQNTLLVPLDSILTRTLSLPDREELYARSLHFVFTSRIVTKVKWYQQEWFGDFLKILGFVLAIFTGGASLSAFLSSMVAGSLSATAILTTLLTSLLEYLITSALVQLFVKTIGGDAALVFAMVFAVAAGVDVLRTGSLTGAPWAKDLLTLASSLTKGVENLVKNSFLDLQKEAESFFDYMKGANEDLQAAQKLLDGNNRLDPLVLWGESPTDYFKRTVHSGNIGVLSISAVSTYVSNSLKLPELHQTLGEDFELQL